MGYNKLKIAIMQPTFNPWLGYFDLIDYVDKFIFLDTVQLTRRSWQVRNKLKINDKEHMFTLPLVKEMHRDDEIISKVKILNFNNNQNKLYSTLQSNYKKAKFYSQVDSFIKELVYFESELLGEYNINIIKKIAEKLQINTEFIILSKTGFEQKSSKGDLILDICRYFNATDYISPLGSKEYLNKEIDNFNDSQIEIFYQYYEHPIYRQLGKEFIPYIGIFDLLYNEGFENSAKIIRSGRKYKGV